jgi:predicted acyltransferase
MSEAVLLRKSRRLWYHPGMEKNVDSSRLFALDFLRGLDMALLTVLGPLVWAVHNAWGLPDCVLFQFTHPWEGFTLWDIVMPGFLYM